MPVENSLNALDRIQSTLRILVYFGHWGVHDRIGLRLPYSLIKSKYQHTANRLHHRLVTRLKWRKALTEGLLLTKAQLIKLHNLCFVATLVFCDD